ncbi:Phosphopantetheine adenylyltransferase [Magnetococcus marinus MC-1]|uniref:Phosphopantetheine adenylyltransferase n=1 Tax=Magnetococcus marinus (strain ATCC BAA-1437 / JCM 17883 / MC-1) TaxID=156889 RepID=A0L7K2_MAGMM|nr:pantetheine-phosphate adenylyltransferase [Magnetococcus marinus]ABK43945.1 Phosphopantetheine adenylyltransferase [Magnetococcus marinus MC-1]
MTQRRTAIYPGTFDPVTLGHVDIIRRASKLFDRLVVGVAVNMRKQPLFAVEERVRLLEQSLADLHNVTVLPMDGLLVRSARQVGACAIVRGLRVVTDFDYEFQMGTMNRKLAPDIETVFLMADDINTFLSSSMVKEVAIMGGDITPFVPAVVAEPLRQALLQRA